MYLFQAQLHERSAGHEGHQGVKEGPSPVLRVENLGILAGPQTVFSFGDYDEAFLFRPVCFGGSSVGCTETWSTITKVSQSYDSVGFLNVLNYARVSILLASSQESWYSH